LRLGSAVVRDSDDLAVWIHAAATEIAEYLAGDTVIDSPEPFPKHRLCLLEADAVNQVMLLRKLLLKHASGLEHR
jgi:hypothetical protein